MKCQRSQFERVAHFKMLDIQTCQKTKYLNADLKTTGIPRQAALDAALNMLARVRSRLQP